MSHCIIQKQSIQYMDDHEIHKICAELEIVSSWTKDAIIEELENN